MLVLRRHTGQRVLIDQGRIEIIALSGSRWGIIAPPEVDIVRGELVDQDHEPEEQEPVCKHCGCGGYSLPDSPICRYCDSRHPDFIIPF